MLSVLQSSYSRDVAVSSSLGTESKRSKYRLLGLVGQGQFGRVYCAVHRKTGKLVALKDLDRQRFPTHKFLRELRFLLSLQHPNIVTCQALEQTPTGRYLVMDYCEGGTLRNLMTEDQHLQVSQSLKLVADILAGLEHAHQQGIVHCDIKPENILLNVSPGGWTARISDFGIARLCQESNHSELGNTGSPAYMAPERFYGQHSPTSDLYSVGILLFELFAGHRPFSGTPSDLMSAHLNCPVQLPDSIPAVWQPFVLKSLQKLSARRFRSAGEMLAALQKIAIQAESGAWSGLTTHTEQRPLLTATVPLSPKPLPSCRQEDLQQPIAALAGLQAAQVLRDGENGYEQDKLAKSVVTVSHASGLAGQQVSIQADPPLQVYRASANRVTVQICTAEPVPSPTSVSERWQCAVQEVVPDATSIRSLLPRPQGCFAVTQQSLHLISVPYHPEPPRKASRCLVNLSANDLVAIDPQGQWLAAFRTSSSKIGYLAVQRLAAFAAPHKAATQVFPVDLSLLPAQPFHLLVLDSRHIALLMHMNRASVLQHEPTPESMTSTLVKIFTRRGTVVGSLYLPLHIERVALTAVPYQLLAVECNHPESVVLVDLKPYRLSRIGVALNPKFLVATEWGYIFANSQGLIVFVDQEGRHLGQMQAAHEITAMTALSFHQLLVATWTGQQGYLHWVDLREAGLDLLF